MSLRRLVHSAARARRHAWIAMPWAAPAFASGREGAAVGDAVALIVYVALAALVASLVAGACWGAWKARQQDQPVSSGCTRGMARGFVAFLALAAGTTAVLVIVGAAFIVLGFLSGDRLGAFWSALVEAWNLPPEEIPKGK